MSAAKCYDTESTVRALGQSCDLVRWGDCDCVVNSPRLNGAVRYVIGETMNTLIVTIERDDVEAGDVSQTVAVFDSFSKSPKTVMNVVGRVELSVSGYDDDPRSLWQIPEVRRFFKSLRRKIPHMLLFLCPERKAPNLWALLCCKRIDRKSAAAVAPESLSDFITEGFAANNAFCRAMGIDPASPELVTLALEMTDALLEGR